LQRFCKADCRQALRRVLIRERRWRSWWASNRSSGWREDDS
jgi:hypothetical protein